MTTSIFARQLLTSDGWRENLVVEVADNGCITDLHNRKKEAQHCVGILLPALSNVHSHSFQRAMAGLSERRGHNPIDDFWTWRKIMYQFLGILTPDDIQAIAAQVQMEMLKAGFAASAEFHYVHHDQNGRPYAQLNELSLRHFNAALITGIGYTHLPVLYMQAGLDGSPLSGGQLRFKCDIDQFENLYSSILSNMKVLPSDAVLGIAPHSMRAVTKQGLHACTHIQSHGPVHIHAAEQVAEVREVEKHLGARPVRWLLDNLPIDHSWCLIHATQIDAGEIRDLACSGAVAGLCPITEANLGDGIFAAQKFMQQGGQFGIGSDSNIKISLTEELRMLEVSQRLRDKKRVVLTSDLSASNGRFLYEEAAKGGAQALGRNSGKIEIGALADLMALDDNSSEFVGLTGDTILDTWVFTCNDNLVTDVWSAGRHNVVSGKHVNEQSISTEFYNTIAKLRTML